MVPFLHVVPLLEEIFQFNANQTISELGNQNIQSIRESFRDNTPKSVCKTCINIQ